jgi:transposase
MMKTDKRAALGLANTLYNQLALGIQVADKAQLARKAFPPSATAAQLKGLFRHRYELLREATQRKNKLTAICDEIFPELTQVLKNPTRPTALAIRERFPTPHALATASLSARKSVRGKTRMLSDTKLLDLQRLAASSIGTKDMQRKPGLLIEQTQLIRELHLLQEHMVQLETEITSILEQSREGQIVQSFGIGPIQTATILAAIGSIENFPNAGSLKSYCGWSPTEKQSGLTLNSTRQTRGGTRMMKQMMYLIVTGLISRDTEWAKLYDRLVQAKCPVDPRTGERSGKVRIIGRVAGQLIETMYALLKTDAEVLSKVPAGKEPPPPLLYDPERHRRHREGHYEPLKVSARRSVLTLLPNRSE